MSHRASSWSQDPVPSQPQPPILHSHPHHPSPQYPQHSQHSHQPSPTPYNPRQGQHHTGGLASWPSQNHDQVQPLADDPWAVDAHGKGFGDEQISQPRSILSSIQVSNTNDSRYPAYVPPQSHSPPSKRTLVTQGPFETSPAPAVVRGPTVGPALDSRRDSRQRDQYAPSPPEFGMQSYQSNGHFPPAHLVGPQAPQFFPQPMVTPDQAHHGFPPPDHRNGPRPRHDRSLQNSIRPIVPRQWGNRVTDSSVEVSSTTAVPATPPKHVMPGQHWDDVLEIPRQGQDPAATTESSPWNPGSNVANWAQRVQPLSPPVVSSARATPPSFSPRPRQLTEHPSSPQASDDAPERPNSAIPEVPPTTVYISDDESAPSTKLPTPHATPRLATIAIDRVQAQVRAAMGNAHSRARSRAPAVLEVSVESEAGAIPYQPPIEDDVDSANSGRRRRQKQEPGRPYFKSPISAIYSPQWADRRLLVELPVRMKCDVVLQAFQENYSRYGTVKYAFHHERNGDSCEKGFVIFAEAESLHKCLDDPGSRDLTIPSAYTRSVDTFKVILTHLPPQAMTRSIFIQVTGARYDDPPAVQAALGLVLPEKITLVAVSRQHRATGQMRSTARILETGQSPKDLAEGLHLPKKDVRVIDEIYLGREVAEKDFIPRLCDYFGEVCWSPIPPSNRSQGWIVMMGGPLDAMKVMDELGRVPGILSRWAQTGEGSCSALSELSQDFQESPLGRLERHLGQPVQRNPFTGRAPPQVPLGSFPSSKPSMPGPPLPQPLPHAFGPQVPALLLPPISIAPQAPPQPDLAASEHGSHHSSEIHRHLLRHTLVPTYRGRVLEQVEIEGEIRFIDRAAVFVGRLSKVYENLQTLFQRFSKYGPIFAIEYNQNQKHLETTYAIARVLFNTEDAARRAIQYENGAISFGSGIKVEERKVLPADVETKEMYFDHLNRPVDPYNKNQYSPNSHLRSTPYTSNFVSPPQLEAIQKGPPPVPPFGPVPQVAFGYGPPPAFWNVGPGSMGEHDGSTLPPTPPQQMDGQLPSGLFPGVGGPQPGEMIPMIRCMGQNYYPYPVPNGVYTPDMFFQGPLAPPMPSPPHSPIKSTHHALIPAPSVIAESDTPPDIPTADSSHSTQSPIRIKEFLMKNGNYTPVYDPDDLKRYQRERGLPEFRVYIPLAEDEAPSSGPGTVKAASATALGEPVYASIASPTNGAPTPAAKDQPTESKQDTNLYVDPTSDRPINSYPKQRIRATHSSRDIRRQSTSTHKLPPRPPASSQGSSHGDEVKYQRKGGKWMRDYASSSPNGLIGPNMAPVPSPTLPTEVSATGEVDNGGW